MLAVARVGSMMFFFSLCALSPSSEFMFNYSPEEPSDAKQPTYRLQVNVQKAEPLVFQDINNVTR